MHGNNSVYNIGVCQTNHSLSRLSQRDISPKDISLALRYGSEEDAKQAKRITVDFSACDIAIEDDIDLIDIYGLTLIVSYDGVLKTAYYKS